MNDILQNELKFIDKYYDELFIKFRFILVHADCNQIQFSNSLFTLSFDYDLHFKIMQFGGLSIKTKDADNPVNIRDLIDYMNKDIHEDDFNTQVDLYRKQHMTKLEAYYHIINKYLNSIFKNSDASWEKPVSKIVQQKYQL